MSNKMFLHCDDNSYLNYRLKKPGQSPHLVYMVFKGFSEFPDRFIGSISVTDFIVRITRAKVENVGFYLCWPNDTILKKIHLGKSQLPQVFLIWRNSLSLYENQEINKKSRCKT